MALDIFHSKKNANVIKQILLEHNPTFNSQKLDVIVNDTINYVSSNVNKKTPNGMSQNDYLLLMNKKVYDIIEPLMDKTNKNQNNIIKQTQHNLSQNIIKKVTFENNSQKVQKTQTNDNMQEHLFDSILLKNYEAPNIIDYPKPSANKSTTETMENKMKQFETEREQIIPKLKPIDFTIKTNDQFKEPTAKLYNDLLQTYNSQINNMTNFDIQNKEKETQINQLLEYQTNLNDNSTTPIDLLLNSNSNINLSLNTQLNNGINSSVNTGINTSFNNGINTLVNDGINSVTGIGFNEPYMNRNNDYNEFNTAFKRNDANIQIDNINIDPIQNILNNTPQTYNTNQIPSLEFGNLNLKSNTNNIMLDEPEYKISQKSVFFTFDSSERDLAEYPNPFYFQVKFSPIGNNLKYDSFFDSNGTLILREKNIVFGDGTNGSVPQTYDDIYSVYCSSAIVPNNTIFYNSNDITKKTHRNVYKEPYLYLIIPELRGPYKAGSVFNDNAFSKLIIDTASPTFATIFTDNIYDFTTLRSSEPDEFFIYNPVTNGKMDKMTLSLTTKYGSPYNFGIDKLFIQSFSEGNEITSGYCGNSFVSTKFIIQNNNPNYSFYCKYFNQTGECDILNSHPIKPGDNIVFYTTMPNVDQIAFFEDYVVISKMKYNKKAGNIYIYLTYLNNSGEEVPINLNGIIPQQNILNQFYIAIFNKNTNKYYYLKILNIHDHFVTVSYSDTIPHFKDYSVLKVGIIKSYPRGLTNENQNSLFRLSGYTVISVGTTEDTKWEIEINFPYHLLEDCYLNPTMYEPGSIFLIQEKLQITYTFKIVYNIKDYTPVLSNLNG